MRKLYLSILVLFLCQVIGFTQVRFGLKLGVSSNDIDVDNLMIDEPGLSDRLTLALEEANYGVHFGIQLRAYLGNTFFMQPELIFNSNTVEFGVDNLDEPGLGRQLFDESYQYLDIPILFGWELGPLRLQAGPTGHVYLNNSSDLFDFQDYDQNFNDLTIGYLWGFGLDIWNLTIDVRREGNFTNFGNHIRFGETRFDFDETPSRWLFTLGYLFGEKNR